MALDVKDWIALLSNAKEERKLYEPTWDRLERQVYRHLPQIGSRGDKLIRVNLAYPTIKIFTRACTANNPYIYIRPLRPEAVEAASLLQFLENDLWRIQRRKHVVRQIVLEGLIKQTSTGLVHLKEDAEGNKWPWLTPVRVHDLWLDPAADHVDNAYYIFRKVLLPLQEARKRWPKADLAPATREEIMGTDRLDTRPLDRGAQYLVEGISYGQRACVYEVHDQLNHQIAVISENYLDGYLEEPRDNPYPFDSNFVQLRFNERPNYYYGVSDLEPVEIQQDEFDRIRTAMLIHAKRFAARKYVVQRASAKKDTLQKLESAQDGAIVEIDDTDQIKALEDAPLPNDILAYMEAIRQDYREITGLNEYMMASRVPQTKTAYETEQIVAGAQARVGEKPDTVADFCEEVARKDIAIMKEFFDQPRVIRVAGPKGIAWQQVTKWDLQGEHEVEVQLGSTRPKEETHEFQRALLLWQTYARDPSVNHVELLKLCLRMQNVIDRDKLVVQQAPVTSGPTNMLPGINPASQGLPEQRELARMLRSPRLGM